MPRIFGAGLSLQRAGGGGIPGGAWVPWDALVSNNPGVGDYTEISTACAIEAPGAIIAVDCNSTTPYVEIADIVFKEGQTVFAFDGIRRGGTVYVQMGDFRIRMPAANPTLEGIYFHWDNMTGASANIYRVEITGGGEAYINRCIFNADNATAGVPIACYGIRVAGGTVPVMRDVQLIQNPFLQRPLYCETVSGGYFEHCVFYGGDAGMISSFSALVSCTNMIFNDCYFNGGASAFREVTSGDRNTFNGCTFYENSMLGNAFTSLATNDKFTDCNFIAGANGGISITGSGTKVEGCFVSVNGTSGISVLANDVSVSNCMEDPFTVTTNFLLVGSPGPGGSNRVSFANCHGVGGFSVNDSHYISFFGCSTLGNIAVNSSGFVNYCERVTFVGCRAQGTFNSGGVGSRFILDFNGSYAGGIAGQNFQQGVASHISAVAPTVNDDLSRGYMAGISRWYLTGAGVFYECKVDTVGAAVWAPAGVLGGACPWNVLVHPTTGYGNYTTINQACSASGEGAVIAVCPGTYAEGLDITLKEGQTVFALGGLEGDDFTSVIANLTGGVRVRMQTDDTRLKGIYFKYTALVPAEDHEVIRVTGTNCVLQDCTIDTTPSGAQAHRALYLAGNRLLVENININCDPLCYRPLEANGLVNSVVRHIYLTGGNTNGGALEYILINDCQRNSFENINVNGPSITTVAAGTIFGIQLSANCDPDHFRDIYIELGILVASGAAITYNGLAVVRTKEDTWTDLTIDGSYNGVVLTRVDGIKFTDCAIGVVSGNFVANDCFQLTDASLCLISGCDLYATAGRCVATVAGVTFSNGLSIVNSNLTTAGLVAVLSGFADSFWNITDCFVIGDINYTGGGGYLEISGVNLLGTLNISGALTTDVFAVNSFLFAVVADTSRSRYANCYIFNISIGTLVTAQDTFLTGCTVFGTLTNGANSDLLVLAACIIATFTDNGNDTVRDVYTQETIAGNISIRGSRDFNNTGAGGPFTLTLPDPAVVQVSVGYRFRVTVIAAQTMQIVQPALQAVYANGFSSTPGAGGNVNSNTPYSVLELEYKGNNAWVAVAALGNWNFV